MSTHTPPMEQIKAAQRTAWMTGDFGRIAATMTHAGDQMSARVVAEALLPPGARVLDVATGTGNVAIPLARAGFAVTGVDIIPGLLDQARARAAQHGLALTLDEGDAEALPYPDASFDAVVSMFGAMFAPRHGVVAAELARVLRPGGLLAMGNWTPESFSAALFRVTARHVPPPAGLAPPILWGQPPTARERLAAAGFQHISTEVVAVNFRLDAPPPAAVALFRTYFGPTTMAYARLNEAGKAALDADLTELWTQANIASDPEHATEIANEYLYVSARRS